MSGPLPTYRTNLKTLCTAQRRSVHTLIATAQQPHSRDIFNNQKNLPLDKLINQQEPIHAYKKINGTYLLNDFLNHGDVGHQIQLRNIGDLRIPLYATTHSQLFVRYYFSSYKVTSASASIAISHRILLCVREVVLSEKRKYHSVRMAIARK